MIDVSVLAALETPAQRAARIEAAAHRRPLACPDIVIGGLVFDSISSYYIDATHIATRLRSILRRPHLRFPHS